MSVTESTKVPEAMGEPVDILDTILCKCDGVFCLVGSESMRMDYLLKSILFVDRQTPDKLA